MRHRSILVTGATGQLGRALVMEIGDRAHTHALSRSSVDITDWHAVRQAITDARPHIVIHAAAATDVDNCERDPAMAFRINSAGTRNVVRAAAAVGSTVVYVSTNYVFDGSKETPYHEFDQPRPISVYGASKLAGEQEALAASPACYIVRTAWLYSASGRNFTLTMKRLMQERSELSVVADQYGNPTFATDLARSILAIVDRCPPGTYHAVNAGVATWFEWATRIRDTLDLRTSVHPIRGAEYERAATPPQNGTMESLTLEQFEITLPHWHDALERCLSS